MLVTIDDTQLVSLAMSSIDLENNSISMVSYELDAHQSIPLDAMNVTSQCYTLKLTYGFSAAVVIITHNQPHGPLWCISTVTIRTQLITDHRK